MDNFRVALHGLMQRQGMSQAELAIWLGVPISSLRKWLNGERQPSQATVRLVEIMAALETIAPDLARGLKGE